MTTYTNRFNAFAGSLRVPLVAVMSGWTLLSGCAFRDLGDLGPPRRSKAGAGAGAAGTTTQGGTSANTMAVSGGRVSSYPEVGGASTVGDGGAAGTTSTTQNQAGTAYGAVGTPFAGASGLGGSTATTGGAMSCPPPDSASEARLLTPPSSGFEQDHNWTTTNSSSAVISRVEDAAACEGTWYIVCAGRTTQWDGPATDLLPFVTMDHVYSLSVLVRFDPNKATLGPQTIALNLSRGCVVTTATTLSTQTVGNDWVCLSGSFKTGSTSACPQYSTLQVSMYTSASAATNSIDVDDFKLWESPGK